jgi:hypothetical protein
MYKRIVEEDEKHIVIEPEEIDYTKIDLGPYNNLNHSQDFDGTTVNDSPREHGDREHRMGSVDNSYVTEDEEDEEEPVIFEAASAQATIITPQAIKARGGLIDIPKRPPPPPLPPRNIARTSKVLMVDQASGQSPMKEEFEQVDLHGVSHTNISPPLPERPVVMEDLERTYSLDTEKGLKGEVEDVLKEQHLDGITSSVEESIKLESNEMKTAVGVKSPNESEETERDDFHSVPTTPMEAITVN